MPSQVAHVIAGAQALEALGPAPSPAPARACLEPGQRPWFNLGCQGPDIFYHNQRTKPSALHFGALAHRRGYGTLLAALVQGLGPIEAGEIHDSLEAYILGFSTHAALDRALHPYIVYFSGWPDPKRPETEVYRGCHAFLERLLDLALLDHLGLDRGDFDHRLILPLEALEGRSPVTRALEGLLGRALSSAYPRAGVDDGRLAQRMANALKDAGHVFRLTNPGVPEAETGWTFPRDPDYGLGAIALLYPPGLPEGLDLGNEGHAQWSHPAGDGRTSTASLWDLFAQGVTEAGRALQATAKALGGGGTEGLGDLVGTGGLSIADSQGLPCPALLSQPLPLRAVMEAELKRRLASA